jgi:tetratricopeptide (TPR) repeat protein
MALQILDVQGEAAEFGDLVRLSPIHQAHQEFREGRDALEDWRLSEAQEAFGNAIELDSAFALAHYQLALTMYWRTIRDPERITTGEVIQFHVRRADIFGDSTRLRPGHRRELDAFKAFWEGDYETARDRYAAILEEAGTNLDALVQAGAVELEDPWVAPGPDDEFLGPRGDLNRARAMFDSAVFLTPHVQLAWGGLFEIDREVARVALGGKCFGFVPPGGAPIPPYVLPEAARVLIYCPYVVDGEIYWSPDSLPAALHERAAREATALRDSTVGRLNFWAEVESDQARPHEELAEWMLWERTTRRCEADPTWGDSLFAEARRHTERALSIRGDTTPEDLIRLGSLLLATGDAPRAADHTDRALRALGDWQEGRGPPPPKSAANVYLAVGRGQTAAEILEAVDNEATWSVDDSTVDLGAIPGGPVLGTLQALGALGMAGDDDAGIADRFRRVERTWEGLDYSERQQALLRSETTSMVSPALLRQPTQRERWFADWEKYGLAVPTVWQGLMVAETSREEAREHLDGAIREYRARRPSRGRAFDYYLPIQLAERLGEDSISADLAERAATCPLRLDNFDFGWGMMR